MQTSATAIIGYGKLPVHGDFIRHNASGSAVRALDDWLQRGLYLAREQLGSAFDTSYDDAPVYRFLFAPREADAPLIGVMRPSRDRSRRTYPFVIACEPESGKLDPRHIVQTPIRFNAFLDQATTLSADVVNGQVGHREIGDLLDRSGLITTAANGSSSAYEHYLNATTFGSWCVECWGFFDDSRKYLLFRNLIEMLSPMRGSVPSGFTLGLEFPVGAGKSSQFIVGFWIDVCFRLLDFPDVTPVIFWSESGASGDRGSLALFFRLPSAHALIPLLSPGAPESDYLCRLETMGGGSAADAALSIPQRLGALLESEHISLKQFLDSL